MELIVDFLIWLTDLMGGNLGLSIIFIGVVSRAVFYPFLKTSHKHLNIQRELKPKLDEIKRRYSNDRRRYMEEQAKLLKDSGFNPYAGCLAPLIQAVVGLILFFALQDLIKSGLDTSFLVWDLARPDTLGNTLGLEGFLSQLPGILVILTSIATFIQSKMMLPEAIKKEKEDTKKDAKKKEDLAESLMASQGQFVYLFPLIILFTGRLFPSGLALYWLVNTLVGVVQQYYISGLGGFNSWRRFLKRS